MSRAFFAACTLGLEPVLKDELDALGAQHTALERGGVRFQGDLDLGLRAVLWLRSATRVSERLFGHRYAPSRDALYDAVRSFDWRHVVTPTTTIAVNATVRNSRGADPHFVALVVKDAVADAVRELHGTRPDVDTDTPDVPLRLLLMRDRATLLRDLDHTSLHRRGWRPVQVKSPLSEAIAAGLLLHTGWDRRSPLVDPMCGSGTFAVEAAHLAADRAPGLTRRPAALAWPDVEAATWDTLVAEAHDRFAEGLRHVPPIEAADAHPGAIAIARQALVDAEVHRFVRLTHSPVAELEPAAPPAIVVANPPWGQRIGQEDHATSWSDLGTFLKHKAPGSTAWLLSGAPELTAALRLRATERMPIRVGPVDARWIRYDLRPAGT